MLHINLAFSKTSMTKHKNKDLCTRPRGLPGPHPGARPGEGRQAPGGWAYAHGVRSGSARRNDMGLSSCGPTTRRRSRGGPVQWGSGDSLRRGPWQSDPRLSKPTLGTWSIVWLGKNNSKIKNTTVYPKSLCL